MFDRLDLEPPDDAYLTISTWEKREIENYLCKPDILIRWAKSQGETNLFVNFEASMKECIKDNTAPAMLKNLNDEWWNNAKVSDEYLPKIFECFFKKVNLPNTMTKGRFYELVDFININEVDKEIYSKLDAIFGNLFENR